MSPPCKMHGLYKNFGNSMSPSPKQDFFQIVQKVIGGKWSFDSCGEIHIPREVFRRETQILIVISSPVPKPQPCTDLHAPGWSSARNILCRFTSSINCLRITTQVTHNYTCLNIVPSEISIFTSHAVSVSKGYPT